MTKCHWKLDDDTYEFIKGEVTNVFVQYKIRCVPVSGFEMATKMGITMIPYSSLSLKKKNICLESMKKDGFLIEQYGHDYIFYNDEECYERQNFTLLHEVGHVVLDHSGSSYKSEREEAEADFFAKYAIAPPALVHALHLKSAKEIFRVFNISRKESVYAFKYYCKWLKQHNHKDRYESYESQLINLYEKENLTLVS